jgi:hypothetical protein
LFDELPDKIGCELDEREPLLIEPAMKRMDQGAPEATAAMI